MTDSARFSWTVLLPVKVLAQAKSRLAVLAGDRRRELALALASDTVTAVLACPEVARVVVVTSDPAAGPLLAALGAVIVADEPADRADRLGTRGTPNGVDAETPGESQSARLLDQLGQALPSERQDLLVDFVRGHVAQVLRVARPKELGRERRLMDLGEEATI